MQQSSPANLSPLTTFGVPASCNTLSVIANQQDLEQVLVDIQNTGKTPAVLGGGSNILFVNPQQDWLILNELKGIDVVSETADTVHLRIAGGENWHELVLHTLEKGWNGIENLSLIPGKAGAAPIQNIGAYGIEIKDVLLAVHGVYLADGSSFRFHNSDCEFGYRDSIFKRKLKGKILITSIELSLRKDGKVNTQYGDIQKVLEEQGIADPSPKDVSNAVIAIRSSKLPDPKVLGNGGSFFKNPIVDTATFEAFHAKFPLAPYYPSPGGVKIPAGWLIDQAGWKGHKRSHCGVHEKQALVLVNLGSANGSDIRDLAMDIIADVKSKYGIELEPEVNFW